MNKILIALVLAIVMSGNVLAVEKWKLCERLINEIENSLNASNNIEAYQPELKQKFLNNVKTLSEVYDNICKD